VDQPWEFELVHRAVFRSSDSGSARSPTLVSPDGTFHIVKGSTRIDEVNGTADFVSEETAYRITLADPSLGLHKAVIALVNPDGRVRIEAPVTWRRSPFLSSVPDRVVLGSRPVRAFLRCPDERIEMATVLDAPKGVRAFISGPREVTLALSEGAPAIIKGNVHVKTTASGPTPLNVPVVSYRQTPAHAVQKSSFPDRP
jgi:hypothetical protein